MKEAFFAACDWPKPAQSAYVSLYVNLPFYGGPQEGGWWGNDVELVAYQQFATLEAAEAVLENVQKLAERQSKAAKDGFNRQCLAETAWLEERGLDDSFLPEVDGEATYFVVVEDRVGSRARVGNRHYE